MKKQHTFIAGLTITLTISGTIALLLFVPSHIQELKVWITDHRLLGALVIILWRIVAIVIPPLPGGILSYALIPVLGWFWSFVYASIGVLVGASIAFWLARIFRESIVRHFVPLQQLHLWQSKLSGKTEFVAFLGIRLTTASVSDFISYIAGVTKLSYAKFIVATILAVFVELPIYYFGESIYKLFDQKSAYIGFGAFILFLGVAYLLGKKQFFDKKQNPS